MGKPITIDVQAKLALKNQTDVIKGFVDGIDQAFSDLDMSDTLKASFNKAITGINKTYAKTQSLFGKGIFDEKDLKKSATYIDSIATALAGMEYKVKTSTAESLGLGSKELAQARKELKKLNQDRSKALNKGAANVLDTESLEKFMQLSKAGFSGEKSLAKNLSDIGDAAAKAQGNIASLGKQLNQLQDEQTEAKIAEDSFKEVEKGYNNYLKLQRQKVAASSFAGVKTKFRKREEIIGDYNNLIAQQITEETLSSGEGHSLARTIGEWLELEPAEIDSFATKSASVIVKTLQDKVSLFLNSAKNGGKGINALFDKANEVANTQLDDSIVKKYTDAKAVTEKYSSQSDYNEKIEKLQESIREATELINLINSLKAELETATKKHAEAVDNKYDKIIDDQKKEINRLNERDKEPAYSKIKAAAGDGGIGAYYNLYNKKNEEIYLKRKEQADAAKAEADAKAFKANLKASVKHWMGTQQVISLVKQGIRQAYQDIKALDKSMTDIAVVTDFSVSDLWGKINEYMAVAKQYGVTTQGVYEVSQLYFQQGLGEADTMALTTETLKMARIAGMEYKDAADGMTVALRGFKMEMEDAARVTDVYSKVAAVTASDSQELIEAMSKTASSAASVGSGFEETTAMLAVMIEATREAPTNIGSAMKSIISRYGEMTRGMSVDTEGEEIVFNKVDAALQSVGVSMKDATGQFREFDEVIYELASKWESLDSLSQRYVATVFAGNRQQSRFLALMSNYDRLVEVTEDAQNSEDAGLLQYSKTLDSLETKWNNVKTSFQQFYMDIFDGEFFKGAIDGINNILKGFNKLGKAATAINLFSLIIGTKAVANSFIDNFVGKFVSGFSQITQAGKNSAEQIKNSFLSSANQIRAGLNTIKENNKNFIGPPRATKAEGVTQILTAAPIQSIMHAAGSGLTLLGTGIAAKNQGLGGAISSAGSGLNVAASTSMALAGLKGASGILGTIGSMAGPIGLAAGALTAFIGIISTIPSEAERAQQEAEKAAEKAEKSNIKRAEAREKVRSLEDGVEKLEELGKKRFDSDEDMQAWLDANNALFEKFPELAVKFDEAGNSIVNLTSAEAELTAAREAASNAAKQAAADEYDKAKEQLEAKKVADLSNIVDDKYLQTIARSSGIDGVRSTLLHMTGIEKDESAWAWAAMAKDLGYNDLIASFVENVQNGILKPQKGFSQTDVFTRLLGVDFWGNWASEEEVTNFIQGINTYRKEIDSLNRYVDAARASKIAAESASVLDKDKKYIDSDYKELESAYEVIQDQVIEQFSFDAEGNKLTGEIDSNKVASATTALADDFVSLYTDLFNSNNVEEFNSLIQKALTGKITQTDFKENLKELGASEEIINAYLGYIEDSILLSPDDFKEALESRNKGNEKYSHLLKLNNELTEQNRRDIINNEIEFFEAQLEAGKIAEGQIADYIEAYANFIEENKDNQNLIDIFTSGNLTTLEGIQETEKALQEAGWAGELDWATLIPTSVINFTTSYENLMDKTITSLEGMSESFDTAAGEMDLKDAQEIAKKLGKDVSIFDDTFFEREGESFFATQKVIDLLIEKQKADIEKEAEDYLAAIGAAKTEISAVDDKDSLLKKYGDTAAAAVAWAKGNIEDFDQTKTVEDFDVDVLQDLINQYYTALENNIKSSSENYIDDLTAQLQASFDLQQEGRNAKKAMISDALDGLGIAKELQEQAYSLLGKLSQDVTANLDETEYALFDKVFGDGVAEKYLITDGAGGWQIDASRIDEFVENYQSYFGTFITNLLFNTATSTEEKLKNLLSDAASFGEDTGRGEMFDENDLRQMLEPILGSLETEIWKQLLIPFKSGDWLSFNQILSEAGKTIDSEAMKGIKTAQGEFISGTSRSADELAKDILQSKYDYISGDLSKADIANMSGVDDGGLKETLVAWSDEIGDWAKLSIEEKLAAVTKVLKEDTSLSELERTEELEKRTAQLLSEQYGHITSRNDVLEESYNILAETGGKNLTEEQVAALLKAGEKLEYSITADGYQIVNTDAISKAGQDALAKYYDTLSQNAAKGAEELLGAMAEGTLTGAQIQDYFKELNLDILYEDAQALANGTIESLYGAILNSLDKADINVKDKLQEIYAIILDGILNAVSSGFSSLGAGIEGTLSAADYAALTTKYKLSGKAYKTSRGLQLSTADQQKLISKLYENASSQGMQAQFGDQLWEVWRDSTEDTVDGYTAIEKEIAKAKAGQAELTGETKAYVEALQQARAAAMFDEDAAEFAFMEQDATGGLTKNFDKFVDNIDKVKDTFSAFKSKEAVGYQDFYNMMDYMNKFGANGGTNSFIQQIEKAGYTYEDFVNSVVANTDKWGKVDIGGIAAEMGISVDAAMTGMAEGMEEALKEVAQQQIKYLSALEKMLEALLILEQVGNINMSIALDYDGDGNPDKIISDLTQLSEEWESIKDDEKKRLVFEVAIENKFAEIGKAAKQTGKNNLFTHILDSIFGADGYTWENGKLDFSLTDSNIQDVENSLVALQTLASKYSEIIGNRELTPLQAQSLASQLMNGLIGEEGNIIGTWNEFVENILTKLKETDLDNITLEAPVELKTKVTQAGADSPITIGEDGSVSLNDNFTLEQANEFVAEFGIKLVPKEEGSTDLLIQELVGTGAEGEGIDGGETPVKINPQWELADGSAGTLTEAITDAASAEGTTIAPEIPIDPKLFLKEGSTAVINFINDLIALLKGEPIEPDLETNGTVNPSPALLESAEQVITSLVASMTGETFNADLNADGTVTPAEALTASAIQIVTDLEEKLTTDIPAKFTATGDVTYDSDGASAMIIEEIKAALGEDLVVEGVPVTVDGQTKTGELTIGEAFSEADVSEDGKTITGVKIKVDGETQTGEISIENFLAAVKTQVESSPTSAATVINATLTKGEITGADTLVQALLASIPDSTDKEVTINLKPVYSEDSLSGMSAQMFTDYLQSVVDSGDVIGQSYFEALAGKFSSLESEGIGLTQYGMGGFDTQEQYSTSRELIQQIKGELVVDDSQVQGAIKSATGDTKIEAEVVATGEVEMPETEPVDGEVNYNKGEQEEPEDEEASVNYTKGDQEEPSDESASVNYALGSVATPPDATALVHYKIGSVETPGNIGSGWTGSVNNITGSAFANGNVTTLNAGAKLANKTLVGELGPELAVYDGQYHLLGQTGAEFVELPDDALIFNHLQTAGIISGQMKNARARAFKGRADSAIAKAMGSAMATGNVTGPAFAGGGISAALAAVRRAKSVWQGLLNSLSAADLMGAGGGGGGGGGDDNSLKAHIEDLQEWYNLSRQIAKIEQEINTLLAKRKNITDGHEYLKNLRETQKLLTQQVATQQVLVKYQQAQLEAQAQHINTHSIWSQFLTVGEDGLLQYKDGNETNGGKGSLSVLQQMNQMSGEEQVAFLAKLGYSYTDNDGNELEGEELVAKFFEELQKQIDDYDALADAVAEAEEAMADLEAEIAEIEKEIRDNEKDLGKNIYDVIVAAWEENIKNLKEQNELIKEANEAYVNGIQDAIDAERKMYEKNESIDNREQLQRQLALLRRSGGSASEIANLEQQLDDMLKDEYFTNQEDALENIRDANERQAELLDQQVKIQEEQLEYEKENGVIWSKVYDIMQGTDTEILDFLSGNSPDFFSKQRLEQEDMLTEWAKKIGIYTEERQRQNYIKELDANSFNNALVTADGKTDYTSVYNKLEDSEKKTLKNLFERTYSDARMDGKSEAEALKLANEAVQKFLKDWKKAQTPAPKPSSSGGNGGSSGGSSNGSNNTKKSSGTTKKQETPKNEYIIVDTKTGNKSNVKEGNPPKPNTLKPNQIVLSKFEKGGLINYTGPAWVDGSKSKPERILSAEQNKILEEGLAMNAGRSDKLREMFSNFAENLGASVRASISNISNHENVSPITIQPGAVQLNIEQLNDKYDVDELFNDVADRLYSIAARASGRGVNRR